MQYKCALFVSRVSIAGNAGPTSREREREREREGERKMNDRVNNTKRDATVLR